MTVKFGQFRDRLRLGKVVYWKVKKIIFFRAECPPICGAFAGRVEKLPAKAVRSEI